MSSVRFMNARVYPESWSLLRELALARKLSRARLFHELVVSEARFQGIAVSPTAAIGMDTIAPVAEEPADERMTR
jgi:hypothetical protein